MQGCQDVMFLAKSRGLFTVVLCQRCCLALFADERKRTRCYPVSLCKFSAQFSMCKFCLQVSAP